MGKSRIFRTLIYAVATAAWLTAVSLALILRPYIPRAQYPGSFDVMAAAPDATLVAGLDNQQRLFVWDPATERQNPATGGQALGPAYIYRCIVLSPDLKAAIVVGGPASLRDLAASSTGRAGQFPLLAEGTAQIWDLASGKARWTNDFQVLLTGSGPSGIFYPVFSPDGKVFAAACADGVHLWEAGTGEELHNFATSGLPGNGIEFSPDNRLLAVINGPEVCIWDISSSVRVQQFAGTCVAFSPDGRTLAVGKNDYQRITFSVSLRDLQTGEQKSAFPTVAGRMDKLWYSPDGRVLFTHRGFPYDSRTILEQIVGTSKEPDLFAIDASTGKHLIEMRHTRLLPGAQTNRTFVTWTRGPVYVWDLPPRRNVIRLASLALLATLPLVLAAGWIYVRSKRTQRRRLESLLQDRNRTI
jgi:WD40 repeat protein